MSDQTDTTNGRDSEQDAPRPDAEQTDHPVGEEQAEENEETESPA